MCPLGHSTSPAAPTPIATAPGARARSRPISASVASTMAPVVSGVATLSRSRTSPDGVTSPPPILVPPMSIPIATACSLTIVLRRSAWPGRSLLPGRVGQHPLTAPEVARVHDPGPPDPDPLGAGLVDVAEVVVVGLVPLDVLQQGRAARLGPTGEQVIAQVVDRGRHVRAE